MGLLDGIRAMVEPEPVLLQRTEAEYDALVEALYDIIEARQQSFTLAAALKLPPVIRGVSLIAGIGAAMLPLLYRDGQAAESQPRIVRKPDPFGTRYQFVYQTLDALIASQYGEAFWLLTDPDDRGHARSATVLPNAEVRVEWTDRRRILPRYWFRDSELVADMQIKHIAPNRRPGELHGRGPVYEALDYLYPVAEAEAYASSFFSSGGLPLTVLKTAQNLTKEQATELKTQWVESRGSAAEPAVASGGVTPEFPTVDPQKAQMTEARGAGAAIVARILGIPAPLLHVETSGSMITYQNAAGALDELVKTTIAPLYLAPVEQAWSELVAAGSAVRFDLADMQRADVAARFALYGSAIGTVKSETGEPLMTVREARSMEGWGERNTETAHAFDSEPVPAGQGPTLAEVPR